MANVKTFEEFLNESSKLDESNHYKKGEIVDVDWDGKSRVKITNIYKHKESKETIICLTRVDKNDKVSSSKGDYIEVTEEEIEDMILENSEALKTIQKPVNEANNLNEAKTAKDLRVILRDIAKDWATVLDNREIVMSFSEIADMYK